MPWHIGIDEAGYGPNLGPLVQAAVSVRHGQSSCNWWEALTSVVRRAGDGRDSRLVIDDSKKVYAGSKLAALEVGVLATLMPDDTTWPVPWPFFLQRVAPESLTELVAEPWFDGELTLPVAVTADVLAVSAKTFHDAYRVLECDSFRAAVRATPELRFNVLLDESDNKAEVLSRGLRWLIRHCRHPDDAADLVEFAIDRQGGRVYHAALLQSACPEGWIEVVQESASRCAYRMRGTREWTWSFEVEAESRHFTVALASMIAKYVREVVMLQFNRFWQRHVPNLKSTAGYPGDAARYFAQIQTIMRRLGIEERCVWRRK